MVLEIVSVVNFPLTVTVFLRCWIKDLPEAVSATVTISSSNVTMAVPVTAPLGSQDAGMTIPVMDVS